MVFTRNQAKMIAEELFKIIRKDCIEATKEIVKDETEEFICLKDAARILGISPSTMYKKKDQYGCYTKINGRIRFAKSRLCRAVQSGI